MATPTPALTLTAAADHIRDRGTHLVHETVAAPVEAWLRMAAEDYKRREGMPKYGEPNPNYAPVDLTGVFGDSYWTLALDVARVVVGCPVHGWDVGKFDDFVTAVAELKGQDASMTESTTEQNFRLARKMLEQQGEINDLKATLGKITAFLGYYGGEGQPGDVVRQEMVEGITRIIADGGPRCPPLTR